MSNVFFNLENITPSLRAALGDPLPNLEKLLSVAVPFDRDPGDPANHVEKPLPLPKSYPERGFVMVLSGTQTWEWRVESIRSLFRGDKQPPSLGDHPEAYEECFLFLELHVLQLSEMFGPRRDHEMLEIYSALRRRPDGRSVGFIHDQMWQAAALMLGLHPLSEAEYEAILSRLERSCRTFEMGPTSYNYVQTLKQTIGSGLAR